MIKTKHFDLKNLPGHCPDRPGSAGAYGLSPVKTFNSVRLSIRLSNISIMNCQAFYKQDINFVLSKIKKDNSSGPMWSEHMFN